MSFKPNLVIFPFSEAFGESKSKKIPDIFNLLKSLLSTLLQFGVFSLRKQLLLFPQNPLQ